MVVFATLAKENAEEVKASIRISKAGMHFAGTFRSEKKLFEMNSP